MMQRYLTSQLRHSYDEHADVLYVSFRQAESTEGVDTERGFVVLYTWPDRQLAGVTIMDFCERFGVDAREVEVDADPPFVLVMDTRNCAVRT